MDSWQWNEIICRQPRGRLVRVLQDLQGQDGMYHSSLLECRVLTRSVCNKQELGWRCNYHYNPDISFDEFIGFDSRKGASSVKCGVTP